MGIKTKIPQSPIITLGMAAISSTRKAIGDRTQGGKKSSLVTKATANPIGTASNNANPELTNVP